MKKLFLLALLLPLLFSTTGCMTGKILIYAAEQGWKDGSWKDGSGSKERVAMPPPFEGLEKYTK